MQKVTRDVFYFDFQMSGPNADATAVERFLQRDSPRFAFGAAYLKSANGTHPDALLPYDGGLGGLAVRGATAHVTSSLASPTPLALASSVPLPRGSGRVRLIVRVFVPGSGGPRPTRDVEHYKLGSVGIIRTGQVPSESAPLAPPVQWAAKTDLVENWLREDVVAGVDYDAAAGTLVVHSNSHVSRLTRFQAHTTQLDVTAPGELYLSAQLLPKAAGTVQSILSAREVADDAEWSRFLDHVALEGTHLVRPAPAQAAAAAPGPAPAQQPRQPRVLVAAAAAPPQAMAAGGAGNNDNDNPHAAGPPAARRGAARGLRLQRGGARALGAALAGRLFPGRDGAARAAAVAPPGAPLVDLLNDEEDDEALLVEALMAGPGEDAAEAAAAGPGAAEAEDMLAADREMAGEDGDGDDDRDDDSLAAAVERGMLGDEFDADTVVFDVEDVDDLM